MHLGRICMTLAKNKYSYAPVFLPWATVAITALYNYLWAAANTGHSSEEAVAGGQIELTRRSFKGLDRLGY